MHSSLFALALLVSVTAQAGTRSVTDRIEFKGNIVVDTVRPGDLEKQRACVTLRGFLTETGWFIDGKFYHESAHNVAATFCAPLVLQKDGITLKASIDDYRVKWSVNVWDDTSIVLTGFSINVDDGSATLPTSEKQWVVAAHGENSPDPWVVNTRALQGLNGFGSNRIEGTVNVTLVESSHALRFKTQ